MPKTNDYRLSTIDSYLKKHENKSLLRFLTCGSVDDGKSTLIGRLLYDSKMIFEDQIAQAKNESTKYGTTEEEIDLALLVDGLQSEREQGITIDVAYRFFATDKKKYIIADTPGHEQYTRNMVTGASTSDVAIILIDARKGIFTQTRRHSFIVSLLGIKHIVVAINKMDLVDYSQEVFEQIKQDYEEKVLKPLLAMDYRLSTINYIPMSALKGDNVVDRSDNMPWFKDSPLLEFLDNLSIDSKLSTDDSRFSTSFRFPVQYVNRPNLNFRGFCGTIASGKISVGDEITILPSGKTTKVKDIIDNGAWSEKLSANDSQLKTIDSAFSPMAITLTTEDEIDISRGDMIVKSNELPRVSNTLKTMIVWMDETSMEVGKSYDIKSASTTLNGYIEHINYKIDVNTYERTQVKQLELNDIASCKLVLSRPIAADSYKENKSTGSFIIIDRVTNNTVGAGMIVNVAKRKSDKVNLFDIWNTQKQTIAKLNKKILFEERDIVFIKMGKNIGFEQDGKGKEFLRPVLIYKKFNDDQFIGFAMTSKYHKQEKFYYKLKEDSYVILSQIKTYSAKRIKYNSHKISSKQLKEIDKRFKKLVTPS
jgi:sulfate adenylyltransferase subunit 1